MSLPTDTEKFSTECNAIMDEIKDEMNKKKEADDLAEL